MEARSWGLLAAGAASGAVGTFAWLRLWGRRRGKVLRAGDDYFVEHGVAKELALRSHANVTDEAHERIIIALGPRGRLTLTRATWDARPLYQVSVQGEGTAEDIVRDLIIWGLALPGESFKSLNDVSKGHGQPLGIDFKPRPKEDSPPLRPSGSYFKVGDSFFADTRFLETLEWIPGSDVSQDGKQIVIPFWKRGTLRFIHHTGTRMLPEQVGALWRLDEVDLMSVSLDDLLTELLQLGLVGWGGVWRQFPSRLDTSPATGTPPWSPEGRVMERDGELFVNEPAVRFAQTRMELLPSQEGIALSWEGGNILLRPSRVNFQGQRGTVYNIGRASDPMAADFAEELILRRLATWMKPTEGTKP